MLQLNRINTELQQDSPPLWLDEPLVDTGEGIHSKHSPTPTCWLWRKQNGVEKRANWLRCLWEDALHSMYESTLPILLLPQEKERKIGWKEKPLQGQEVLFLTTCFFWVPHNLFFCYCSTICALTAIGIEREVERRRWERPKRKRYHNAHGQ